jgi:hypothetical protein
VIGSDTSNEGTASASTMRIRKDGGRADGDAGGIRRWRSARRGAAAERWPGG